MFGDDFFGNVVVCFTRFAQDKKTRTKRAKGKAGEKTEQSFIEEY
jgi:hypothetical protein